MVIILLSLTSLVYAGEGEWTVVGPPSCDGLADVALGPDTLTIYITGIQVYKSPDGGQSWIDLTDRFPPLSYRTFRCVAIHPHDPKTVYVGTWGLVPNNPNESQAIIYKTTDAGSTWVYAGSGLPACPGHDEVRAIAIDPFHPDTIYAGVPFAGVYKSTDGGQHWVPKVNGLSCLNIVSIVIDPKNSQVIYVAGRGWDPCSGDVFKSVDGGESWVEVDSGIPPPSWPTADDTVRENIEPLAINPVNPNILYAGVGLVVGEPPYATWTTVYKTVNGAKSWAKVDSGLPLVRTPYIKLAVDPRHPDTVYFAPPCYRSTNGGQSWEWFSKGLPSISMGQLLVAPTNPTKIFAATSSNLWSYTYKNGIEGNPSLDLLPRQPSLSQNYPNPFNSNTAISYQLSGIRPHYTTFKVYNILGQEVRTLVDAQKEAGSYRVCWDGTDDRGKSVASGIYFYRIKAGEYSQIRKMVLLR